MLHLPAGDIVRDFRFAFRALRRAPGFTLAAVLSLALGLALTASTMAVMNAYLIRSLPYPAADRLYAVMYAPPGPVEPRGMTALDWRLLRDVIEFPAPSSGETFYLADAEYAQTASGLRASPGFVQALGVRAVVGRTFSEQDFDVGAEQVALISHSFWRGRFGSDPNIVGRVLATRTETAEAMEALRIVGVMQPLPWYQNNRAGPDIMVPLRSPVRTYMVQLREGVPVEVAERRITAVARSVATSLPPDWSGAHLESIHERYIAGIQPMLVAITVAAVLVLVIACANVAVLVLLRALRRQKEVAVRLAVGAGRMHVIRMLAAESSLICAAALVLGLTLTAVSLKLLAPWIESELGRPAPGGITTIALDTTVLLVMGGVGVLVALLLSLVPLFTAGQRRLIDTLRRVGAVGLESPSMRRIRSALITVEIAGALALLVGCGLTIRSAANLMRTDLGFNAARVLRARIVLPGRTYRDTQAVYAFYTGLTDRLAARSAAAVALGGPFPPFIDLSGQPVQTEASAEEHAAGVLAVGAGYFEVLGIRILQGRGFTMAERPGSERVAVISQTLARRLWPVGNAVGRRIRSGDQSHPGPQPEWRTIVGVVIDVRQSYSDENLNDIYVPFLQAPGRFAALHVRTTEPAANWLASLRNVAAELDPYVIIPEVKAFASYDRQLAGARLLTLLLSSFGLLAALLAVLGIYGVIAYAVQQREREIAIRVALGATGGAVTRLFLKQGGVVLCLGIAFGLLGSAAMARVLSSQIYGVQPLDLATLLAASAFMTTAGLLASWWPARRTAAVQTLTRD